jgi:choloylglycine hydrolase
MHAESTTWTSASDLKNLRWYFKTYGDQSIHGVDLAKALAAAHGQIRIIKMDSPEPIDDVSTNFK